MVRIPNDLIQSNEFTQSNNLKKIYIYIDTIWNQLDAKFPTGHVYVANLTGIEAWAISHHIKGGLRGFFAMDHFAVEHFAVKNNIDFG